MATTRSHDLAAIIDDLDAAGRLARVKSSVDPRHELAGIAHRLEGGPRAVLFEAVQGHRWPVLTGLYWNRDLVAGLLGIESKTLPHAIAAAIAPQRVATVDPVVVKSGPVLDVTEKDVDLGSIPVPVHALKDGGPSLDAVVIAKDPETSARNASLQCFQVAGRGTLRLSIDAENALAAYREKARRLDRSLWVTLNCGVGPGLHLAASAVAAAPADADVLAIAGQLHGAPLELVPGTESDVEMAAPAMWALECEIMPGETGPTASRATVHVRRVHRRAHPVFHAILPGLEVWNSAGLLGEARVLALLRQQVPGVTDVYFSPGGAGLYHAIVQIASKRAGWSKHAILAAFAAFPPLKMVTVVEDDIDIRNAGDVARAMTTRLDPATGVVRIDTGFGHGLDPSLPGDLGSKIGFDATQPLAKRAGDERRFKPVSLAAHEIVTPDSRAVAQVQPVAPATLAAPAPKPAPDAAPAAAAATNYDTDRIWQRELAEWKKGGPSAEVETVRPSPSVDWDENRWLTRELEAMQRENVRAAPPKPAPRPAAPRPEPQRAVEARSIEDEDGGFFHSGTA